MIRVDEKLLADGMSDAGGWNKKQLSLLGYSWPPVKGWMRAVVGKVISEEDAEMFVSLRSGAK